MKAEFSISGRAIPKARPRVTRSGYAYTPRTTQHFERLVQMEYWNQCGTDMFPDKAALVVNIEFRFAPPKSWPEKKRNEVIEKMEYPTCRPDLDNLVKAVTDALNGIAYKDDSQIVALTCRKVYGYKDQTGVRISTL